MVPASAVIVIMSVLVPGLFAMLVFTVTRRDFVGRKAGDLEGMIEHLLGQMHRALAADEKARSSRGRAE